MVDESWYEQIEAYLSGSMNPEEALHFKEQIAKDEQLSLVFQMYSSIDEQMRSDEQHKQDEEALKKTLNKLNSIYFRKEAPAAVSDTEQKAVAAPTSSEKDNIAAKHQVRRLGVRKSVAVAAVTVGVIALGITLYLANTGPSPGIVANNKKGDRPKNTAAPATAQVQVEKNKADNHEDKQTIRSDQVIREQLYKANFRRDQTPDVDDDLLADALELFNNKEYSKAIEAFGDVDVSIVPRGEAVDTVLRKFYIHYYTAQSYMAINGFTNAIAELKNALNQGIDSLQIKAQWYLALAYLKKGEVKKTDSLLNIVATNNTKPEYKSKAKRLLNDLKKQ